MAVVCKEPEPTGCQGQVSKRQALGREPGCCLQDTAWLGLAAIPRRQNALGRKLSCCLQDSPSLAFGLEGAAVGDSARFSGDDLGDIFSSSRYVPGATCADFLNTPAGKRDPQRASVGDSHVDVVVDRGVGYKPLVAGESEKAGRVAGNNGNDADSSPGAPGSELRAVHSAPGLQLKLKITKKIAPL
jgi:hypothetical protein